MLIRYCTMWSLAYLFPFLLEVIAEHQDATTTPFIHDTTTTFKIFPVTTRFSFNPNNGCIPPASAVRFMHSEYNQGPNICLLGNPVTVNCQYWRVASLIMLMNNTYYSNKNLQNIQDFVSSVTTNCDSRSQTQVITPRNLTDDCQIAQYGSDDGHGIRSIIPTDTVLPDGKRAGDELASMLEKMDGCAGESVLADSQGGTVFVFTDAPCSDLCASTKLMHTDTIASLIMQRFSVHIMAMGTNVSNNGCIEQVFSGTCTANPGCGVDQYDYAGNHTLQSCENTMMTCPKQTNDKKKMSTLELTLVIGIPSLCLTAIFSLLVFYLYKKLKLNNRKWSQFWTSQMDRTDSNGHANTTHMNHYMDIKAMALANAKDQWEVNMKNVTIVDNQILGTGAFATVYKGTLKGTVPLLKVNGSLKLSIEHLQENSCEAAVKRLPAHADEQSRLDFFHEIDFMKKLGYHCHIISMLGCVSNPFDPLILIEYCHYGDLLRFLRSHKEHVLESQEDVCPIDADLCLRIKDLVSFAWQISDGMDYLSSKKFIHRDLAARNVLITKNLVAKVGDFGLCRYIDSALYTAKGGRLPIKWMALESLKYYEYTTASDVWSFSVLLYEIFSLGNGPFQAIQPLEMVEHLEKGNRLPQPKRCPNEIFSLMDKCWQENASERPTFSEIRTELTAMLNTENEHYGYVDVQQPRALKQLINKEITGSTSYESIKSAEVTDFVEMEDEAANSDFVSKSCPTRSTVVPWLSSAILSEESVFSNATAPEFSESLRTDKESADENYDTSLNLDR